MTPTPKAPPTPGQLLDAWDTLRDQIDDVVCWMMSDKRLNPGGLYSPVGGERAMVELAAEFDTALRSTPTAAPREMKMSRQQTATILALINANRSAQWEMVRQGHRDWRLSTVDMLTFHCGRRVGSLA